jgi:VanZ family protein
VRVDFARVKLFLRYWLPLLVWITLIFVGSTDLLSAEHTSRVIAPFLRWLHPGISERSIMQVQFLVRKAGHVCEYAVLAALLYRALINTVLIGRAMASAAIVLFLCVLYAMSDEFHQSFVPSRTATARDVGIDSAGAFLGVALIRLLHRRTAPISARTFEPRKIAPAENKTRAEF